MSLSVQRIWWEDDGIHSEEIPLEEVFTFPMDSDRAGVRKTRVVDYPDWWSEHGTGTGYRGAFEGPDD